MRLEPTIITEPSYEPVTVDEVKSASRISGTQDDTLLSLYIGAARRTLGNETGRTFFDTELEFCPLSFYDPYGMRGPDSFRTPARGWRRNYIELPRATPLTSIESVTLRDSDGDETIWDSSNYIADTISFPGRLVLAYGQSWPSFTPDPVTPIRIRYWAGEGVYPADAPADVKLNLLMIIGEAYENREASVIPERAIQQMLKVPFWQRMYNNLKVPHEYSEL